ncbi:MAG: ATP-binding protein [Treponema sp.]|nr:ATP-binding protein [Treponema sp.]
MKDKLHYRHSINFRLLLILIAGVLAFAATLIIVSTVFVNSSFRMLYEEKLDAPGRTLNSEHTILFSDISRYVDKLKTSDYFNNNFAAAFRDRELMAEIDRTTGQTNTAEYETAKLNVQTYLRKLAELKDAKFSSINISMNRILQWAGIRDMYIVADFGPEIGYVYILNTAAVRTAADDFGMVVPKSLYPYLDEAYKNPGDAVYLINKPDYVYSGKISRSFTPLTNGYNDVIAIICVDTNLEYLDRQLNQFLLTSVIITILVSVIIFLLMQYKMKNAVIRPVQKLTDISAEMASGNLLVEISDGILVRKDEMGVLGKSFESMRTALEKLFANNEALLDAAIYGKLGERGDSSQFKGVYARLINNTNDTLDVIVRYFNGLPAAIVLLNPEYDMVFCNKSFQDVFSEFNTEQLYRKLLEDDESSFDVLKQKLKSEIENGWFDCLRWFDIAGEKRCYSFMCSSIAHSENKNGAVIVITDETELVSAKDKALQASKAKSEFLSRVSHELRTPLNVILSMAKLGLADTGLEQSIDRFKKIVSSSAHLSNIINDVLEMSRMESGKTEIRYAPLNIALIVSECVSMLAQRAEENNDRMFLKIGPAIPEALTGDEFRIRQILLNLLSNSVKFTKDGTITTEVKCLENNGQKYLLEFSVADTGIGMTKEFLHKVFIPFEQEENYLSRNYQGTGLGLSISNNLVTLMGGSMTVESVIEKGSRFIFTLGFEAAEYTPGTSALAGANDAAKAGADAGAAPEESVSLAGKRILIVDDIEINRMILLEVLDGAGLEMEQARDGDEALDKYLKSPINYYNCILMDVQMPKMNGYDATKAIRTSGRNDCRLPIIAMTANALKEDITAALESGMTGHLAKPIDFDLCINTIKKYLKDVNV